MTVDEVRSTPQRRAVLDVVQQASDHPTAADVLERVVKVLPGIGAATVYRTLARLVESGQILELRLGPSSAVRYDRNVDHHDHLVCDECGALVDVNAGLDLAAPLRRVGARHDFRVVGYDLRIHGLCAGCQPTITARRSHHA